MAIDCEKIRFLSARRRAPMQDPLLALGQNPLRFARRERGVGEVDHFVAAVVELLVRRFSGVGGVEREKEHATFSAELFFVARRVPARAEAFGRQDDELAAGFCDGVSGGLFERAHEGRDACAARAEARGLREHCLPLGRAFSRRAMALEGVKNGQLQDLEVAVAEPSATKKLDFANRLKVAGVDAARPSARS